MVKNAFYSSAKTDILAFLEENYPNFPQKLQPYLISLFSSIGRYEEEGQKIRPSILFTNNIEALVKAVPSGHKIPFFEDENEGMFYQRIKSLATFCVHEWNIYIVAHEDKIIYGIYKAFTSLKEKKFDSLMFSSEALKEKTDKIFAIRIKPYSTYCINMTSLKGSVLNISYALEERKVINFNDEIADFVDASFSKLRTTRNKLREIKILYQNIFGRVFNEAHGTICVVVDKEYEDNGFFADGIWLKDPIELNKLFNSAKTFSEQKLESISQVFIDMLNYDGITIVDNAGRIRAYNVFVETNQHNKSHILGGARKRAAFAIIDSGCKKIVGVYFQSQEGEVFYQRVRTKKASKPVCKYQNKSSKPVQEKQIKQTENQNKTIKKES